MHVLFRKITVTLQYWAWSGSYSSPFQSSDVGTPNCSRSFHTFRKDVAIEECSGFKVEIILASGGNPRLACSRRASKPRATSRLESAASFAVVVGKGAEKKGPPALLRAMAGLADSDLDLLEFSFRGSGRDARSQT